MNWQKRLTIILLVIGIPATIASAWTGMEVLTSKLVWAGQYQEDRTEDKKFMIEMRNDILEDRIARTKDPLLRQRIIRQIERLEEQLEKMNQR